MARDVRTLRANLDRRRVALSDELLKPAGDVVHDACKLPQAQWLARLVEPDRLGPRDDARQFGKPGADGLECVEVGFSHDTLYGRQIEIGFPVRCNLAGSRLVCAIGDRAE